MNATAPQAEGQAEAPEAGQAIQPETKAWYDGYEFQEEDIGYIQNKGWDDPVKAISAYKNLEKFQGVPADQLIKLPKDVNQDGALDPVYDKLGRPESPDKYEISLPEGVQVDENRLNLAKEVGHKIGLNNKQIQALAEFDATYQQQAIEQHYKDVELKQAQELDALQKEWGKGFEERAELGRRFVRNNLPSGLDKEATLSAIEGAIGTAAMLKMFANAGDKFREDSVPDSSGDRPFGYTREQALADRKSLMDELAGDKTRLATYNQGKGTDFEKMKKLNSIITGA